MYRVAILPAINKNYDFVFSKEDLTKVEADAVLDSIGKVLTHLVNIHAMPSYSNMIFIEQRINGEWEGIEAVNES